MLFYLGIPKPHWMETIGVPMFVSDRVLRRRKSFPRPSARWALDSGGFTQLSKFGHWKVSPGEYARRVRRYSEEMGQLDWAAIQDWMCEENILEQTGLTVREHQKRTVTSYLNLMALDPDLPWAPVLQGWTRGDYLRCVDLYEDAGVDLTKVDTVGIGTMCRRERHGPALRVLGELHRAGISLHAFGFKKVGTVAAREVLKSADSMAWSVVAWREPWDCCETTKCYNCPDRALGWYRELMGRLEKKERQLSLPF